MKKDTYLEIAISGRDLKTISWEMKVRNFLIEVGINPGEIAQCRLRDRFETCIYLHSLSKAKKIRNKFKKKWPHTSLKWRERILEPKDWRDKWMLDYRCQKLSPGFMVIPVWEKEEGLRKIKKEKPIILDPGSAFGSGGHETTKYVVTLMETLEDKCERFFDVGLGTGILSVAAHRLGAKEIEGIDLDAASVKVARNNLRRNRFKDPQFRKANFNDWKTRKKYDLVSANLWTPVLIKNREKLVRMVKKGGHLITSGILRLDAPYFMNEFRTNRLRCRRILKGRRWCAVLYKKL